MKKLISVLLLVVVVALTLSFFCSCMPLTPLKSLEKVLSNFDKNFAYDMAVSSTTTLEGSSFDQLVEYKVNKDNKTAFIRSTSAFLNPTEPSIVTAYLLEDCLLQQSGSSSATYTVDMKFEDASKSMLQSVVVDSKGLTSNVEVERQADGELDKYSFQINETNFQALFGENTAMERNVDSIEYRIWAEGSSNSLKKIEYTMNYISHGFQYETKLSANINAINSQVEFEIPEHITEAVLEFKKLPRLVLETNIPLAVESFSGEGRYEAGSSMYVGVYQYEGYKFLGWYNGGELISDKNGFNFTMPDHDVTLTAKFEKVN